MVVSYMIVVSFLLGFVNSEGDLLKPCAVEDIDCLNQSTEKFLGQTSQGIPKYDIRTIDPAVVPTLDLNSPDNALKYHFTNVNVTGLRNQKISDFKMDLKEKSVVLSTTADLTLQGNVLALIRGQKYEGEVTITGAVLGTMRYNYQLEKSEQGVEHFVVGPETISCEVKGEPQAKFNPEVPKEIYAVTSAEEIMAFRKKGFCQLVKILFADVVHNIRAAAKLFPKSAFFTNV